MRRISLLFVLVVLFFYCTAQNGFIQSYELNEEQGLSFNDLLLTDDTLIYLKNPPPLAVVMF